MEIHFKDKNVRKLCEKQGDAEKEHGANCARKLRARLSELEAASRVTDLLAGRPHPLKGDRAGQFALDLAGGKRLVFTPDHDPCPTHPEGGIDWTQVTIVLIECVEDYHD